MLMIMARKRKIRMIRMIRIGRWVGSKSVEEPALTRLVM